MFRWDYFYSGFGSFVLALGVVLTILAIAVETYYPGGLSALVQTIGGLK